MSSNNCDIYHYDFMEFGTRSNPMCGICEQYCDKVNWEYIGDKDENNSEFDPDEEPDEDFEMEHYQGDNVCDYCLEHYEWNKDRDSYVLKTGNTP